MSSRPLPDPRGMSLAQAAYYVGLGETTFERLVASGVAPRAYKITEGRKIWLREDLDDYLDRIAGRIQASAPARDAWKSRLNVSG